MKSNEMMSGFFGSKILTAGTYTGLRVKTFTVDIDDTTISALSSVTDSGNTPVNVLSAHITGGAATALKTTSGPIICQQEYFTNITVDSGGQITIYFYDEQ